MLPQVNGPLSLLPCFFVFFPKQHSRPYTCPQVVHFMECECGHRLPLSLSGLLLRDEPVTGGVDAHRRLH